MSLENSRTRARIVLLMAVLGIGYASIDPKPVHAAVTSPGATQVAGSGEAGGTLEAAASKAGSMGRKVAMSLIGLAFAVAGIVLAFRRNFKEAAGVFVVGIVAVMLATPVGLNVVQDTVNSLFGSQ
jgi:hypothetical protein